MNPIDRNRIYIKILEQNGGIVRRADEGMNTIERNLATTRMLEQCEVTERIDEAMKKQKKIEEISVPLDDVCKPIHDTKDMLPREEFIKFVCSTFDELKELFLKKNTQYGGGSSYNPLLNFELGAVMHKGSFLNGSDRYKRMYEEAKAYERKHVAHVMGNDISAAKVDESLKDIAVYSVIELFMIHKHKQMVRKGAFDVKGDSNA